MEININDFYLSIENKNIIQKWNESISKKIQNYPLIIYGNSGVGKMTLSKLILKNYNIIEYNESLDINDCLKTTDISSMFSKVKKKAVIFYGYNKEITNILNNIKQYSNPIILVINIIDYTNKLKSKFKKCFQLHLK